MTRHAAGMWHPPANSMMAGRFSNRLGKGLLCPYPADLREKDRGAPVETLARPSNYTLPPHAQDTFLPFPLSAALLPGSLLCWNLK